MRDSTPHWQKILAQGFATGQELLTYLNLPTELGSKTAEQQFKTRVQKDLPIRWSAVIPMILYYYKS